MVLPQKLSAKEKRWKVFFVVESKREAKRALATDTHTCTTGCLNAVVWYGVVISRRDTRGRDLIVSYFTFCLSGVEREIKEKEREREGEGERSSRQ